MGQRFDDVVTDHLSVIEGLGKAASGAFGLWTPGLSSALFPAGNGYIMSARSAPGNTVFAINTLFFQPFIIPRIGTIGEIGFRLAVNGGAGSVARVGVYNSDPITLLPTTLISDGGSQVADAGAPIFRGTLVSLFFSSAPMLIWVCGITGVAAPTITDGGNGAGVVHNNASTINTGYSIAQAFGALPPAFPALTPGSVTQNACPGVYMKYA